MFRIRADGWASLVTALESELKTGVGAGSRTGLGLMQGGVRVRYWDGTRALGLAWAWAWTRFEPGPGLDLGPPHGRGLGLE